MSARRGAGLVAVALGGPLLPELAAACPMCLSGQGGGTASAFALGSLMLSVMPLAVIGGAVWYIRRRARALQEPVERPAAGSVPVERASASR